MDHQMETSFSTATLTETVLSLTAIISEIEASCQAARDWIHWATDVLDGGQAVKEVRSQERGPPRPLHEGVQGSTGSTMTAHGLGGKALSVSEEAFAPFEASDAGFQDPSRLRIYCLGKFRICKGDRAIEGWHNSKAKGVLKLLAIHLGRSLPKDVFCEAFWPDYPPESAGKSFRVAMHQLRQRLSFLDEGTPSHQYILSEGGNLSLNLTAPLWIDAEEFLAHWRAGRALEKSARYSEAIAEYARAERLYGGDFLEEDLYEEWTLIKRESLLDVYLSLLGRICRLYFEVGDYESCIEFSQKILERDRCREDAYQYLIMCYQKLGLASRARRWYRLCEESLRRELDCAVSAKTAALYNGLTGVEVP